MDEKLALVTGSTGFVGSHVAAALKREGWRVRMAARRAAADAPDHFMIGDIGAATDWRAALAACRLVVHCAGRVHSGGSDAEFRATNLLGTQTLARQARESGVERFVFLSSAAVFGAGRKTAYSDGDPPAPLTPYARSKAEAELALAALANGMTVVSLRPPLVYGRGAPGNFSRLVRLVRLGPPLPFASITNARSVIHIDDLVAAILAAAAGRASGAYAVAGPETVSTPGFIRAIARAMGKPARLFPLSPRLLEKLASLAGGRRQVEPLIGSFVLNDTRFRSAFGWSPGVGVAAGLQRSF